MLVAIEVEACPVKVCHLVIDKRRELRGIGDEITLVGEQRLDLRRQKFVAIQAFATGIEVDH